MTYRMGKYILSNSSTRSMFFNSVYNYASHNKAYVAGRVVTGGVMGIAGITGKMVGPSALYGDMMYNSSQIDNFARKIILGY